MLLSGFCPLTDCYIGPCPGELGWASGPPAHSSQMVGTEAHPSPSYKLSISFIARYLPIPHYILQLYLLSNDYGPHIESSLTFLIILTIVHPSLSTCILLPNRKFFKKCSPVSILGSTEGQWKFHSSQLTMASTSQEHDLWQHFDLPCTKPALMLNPTLVTALELEQQL